MCLHLWLSGIFHIHSNVPPPPLSTPSLSISVCVCLHGCWAALGRAVFSREPTWDDMPGRRKGGRGGKHTLSLLTNRVLSPLSSSTSCPSPLPALPSSCPQSEVVVWHSGCCSGRLPNCCWSRRANPVGGRDIVLESTSPLVPTAVSQQMQCRSCRWYRDAKSEKRRALFEQLPLLSLHFSNCQKQFRNRNCGCFNPDSQVALWEM